MLITIDPYYEVSFYNTCKEALKNNSIEIKEFMCIKPPYNWYLEVPHKPALLNWDPLPDGYKRYLVNLTRPIMPSDEILLYRRGADKNKLRLKFIMNDCYNELKDSEFIVFNTSGHAELEKLSKVIREKIWYLGRYYNNKYRVCFVKKTDVSEMFIPKDKVLYIRTLDLSLEQFEADFNYKVFLTKDRLIKFMVTPHFDNGAYILPLKHPEPLEKFVRL